MKSIPFFKMSVNGNNFVILDETQHPILSESQKAEFAYFATDTNFGIGCDNMLVVQASTADVLREINAERRYWSELPEYSNTEYLFRMFEPNGEEALSCGNGLKCIARYLLLQYALKQAKILTEVPLENPRVVTIGTDTNTKKSWANLGFPRRIPESLYHPQEPQALDKQIDWIEGIQVKFRENDLVPYTTEKHLTLSGYLVFTGEPHLVVLQAGISIPELRRTLFTASTDGTTKVGGSDKRINFGSSLIQLIGSYVNKNYRHIFPDGININFVRYLPQHRSVEYRCFERGIEKETLACGTGALAVAFVMRSIHIINDRVITVWPLRCRCCQPDAEIKVEEMPEGWVLSSRPKYLFSGYYHFASAYDQMSAEALFDESERLTGLGEPLEPKFTYPVTL